MLRGRGHRTIVAPDRDVDGNCSLVWLFGRFVIFKGLARSSYAKFATATLREAGAVQLDPLDLVQGFGGQVALTAPGTDHHLAASTREMSLGSWAALGGRGSAPWGACHPKSSAGGLDHKSALCWLEDSFEEGCYHRSRKEDSMSPTTHSSTGTRSRAVGSDHSLEQVLEAIRGLDAAARSRVAQALAESEMDARFEQLITSLANKPAVDEISDREIQAEVDTVRRARLRTPC